MRYASPRRGETFVTDESIPDSRPIRLLFVAALLNHIQRNT